MSLVERISKLSEGYFSDVYLGHSQVSEEFLAIKCVKDANILKNEVHIMRQLDHENIVRMRSVSLHQPEPYLVLDFMEKGNLRALLSSDEPLDDSRKHFIASDLASGLSYLHSKGIFHCDVKANNVLLDRDLKAKLADFGLAIDGKNNTKARSLFAVQPIRWRAPELYEGQPFTGACDVFSFAMTLYELLTRKVPFADMYDHHVFSAIQNNVRPALPLDAPKHLVDLMVDCWQHNPMARPTFPAIVNRLRASYIVQNYDVSLGSEKVSSSYETLSDQCQGEIKLACSGYKRMPKRQQDQLVITPLSQQYSNRIPVDAYQPATPIYWRLLDDPVPAFSSSYSFVEPAVSTSDEAVMQYQSPPPAVRRAASPPQQQYHYLADLSVDCSYESLCTEQQQQDDEEAEEEEQERSVDLLFDSLAAAQHQQATEQQQQQVEDLTPVPPPPSEDANLVIFSCDREQTKSLAATMFPLESRFIWLYENSLIECMCYLSQEVLTLSTKIGGGGDHWVEQRTIFLEDAIIRGDDNDLTVSIQPLGDANTYLLRSNDEFDYIELTRALKIRSAAESTTTDMLCFNRSIPRTAAEQDQKKPLKLSVWNDVCIISNAVYLLICDVMQLSALQESLVNLQGQLAADKAFVFIASAFSDTINADQCTSRIKQVLQDCNFTLPHRVLDPMDFNNHNACLVLKEQLLAQLVNQHELSSVPTASVVEQASSTPLAPYISSSNNNDDDSSSSSSSLHQNRVALVIGNDWSNIQPLNNAICDAVSVRNKLQGLGFKVFYKVDGTKDSIRKVIRKFVKEVENLAREQRLLNGDVLSLVYISGHGFRIKELDTLIVSNDDDGTDQYVFLQTDILLPLYKVHKKFPEMKLPTGFYVDMCRVEPFRQQEAEEEVKSDSLAFAKDMSLFGVFSCGPGEIANDGHVDQSHSPFAKAVLENLQPGRSHKDVDESILTRVEELTNHQQHPTLLGTCPLAEVMTY